MRLARYVGGGVVEIRDEPAPRLPAGGLLVQTEACGLCSGELMDWYMDQKVPHVLGHEVTGRIVESDDPRFPVGSRVFAHHHAPCLKCEFCQRKAFVHCAQWKATRLDPGGMAEFFAVSRENLNDAFLVDHLDPRDAALIEPLACVVKSLEKVGFDFSTSSGATDSEDEVPYLSPGTLTDDEDKPCAVIGLGVMGLMHMLLLPDGSVGFETNPARRAWAQGLGLVAQAPNADHKFETIFVCPGSEEALNLALEIAAPGASVVLFAPMPPGGPTPVDLNRVYFSEISLIPCYSCGPNDTVHAAEILDGGLVQAHQVVSDFIELDGLPAAYLAMKQGEILKPMVMFPSV